MTGLNLSQSLQDKQAQAKGSFFDKGLYINLAILLFLATFYGGAHWYLGHLTNQSQELDSQAISRITSLQGQDAERVADFRERLVGIGKNLDSQPNSSDLFSQIENSVVPSVRLTKYEENWNEQSVVLEGVTDNLKYIAQEMVSLKKISTFKKIIVKGIDFDENNKVNFSLSINTVPSAQ